MQSLKDFNNTHHSAAINRIWFAIMEMNSFTLEMLLDAKIDYEDIGKDKFIEKLYDRFQDHKTWGDSELFLDLASCNGCNCNQAVCVFTGIYSDKKFALFFEIKNNKITDIYECYAFGEEDDFIPF